MRIETEKDRIMREYVEQYENEAYKREVELSEIKQTAFGVGFVLGCVMATGFTILFFHLFILP